MVRHAEHCISMLEPVSSTSAMHYKLLTYTFWAINTELSLTSCGFLTRYIMSGSTVTEPSLELLWISTSSFNTVGVLLSIYYCVYKYPSYRTNGNTL